MQQDPALTSEQILGIRFFNGAAEQAVAHAVEHRQLVVAPSGTCFERFLQDEQYRRAITTADIVIPDSGFMVLLWRLLRRRSLHRISGLAYLQTLIAAPTFAQASGCFWVLPNAGAREKLLLWANASSLSVDQEDCYLAPIYEPCVEDETLLALLLARRPEHVIIGLGAGAQEKLGWYLRDCLDQRPAIHCIGGALGFITGDQVAIPRWADRLYLGWFLRLLRDPRVFIPRLWKGRILPWLIWRYGDSLPPMASRPR